MHEELTRELFGLGPFVRYVAFGEGQQIETNERDGLENTSEPTSDRFEELIVNPALLTLTRQRGELDCGGLRYVAIGYGNFTQLVLPTRHGHVSIALERGTDPDPVAAAVDGLLRSHDLA